MERPAAEKGRGCFTVCVFGVFAVCSFRNTMKLSSFQFIGGLSLNGDKRLVE